MFVTGDDPVKLGYVVQLNRPGGTATGVTFLSATLRTKQLELLHELVPNASVIGMLVNSKISASKDHIRDQQAPTQTQSPLPGPRTPTKSSQPSNEGTKC